MEKRRIAKRLYRPQRKNFLGTKTTRKNGAKTSSGKQSGDQGVVLLEKVEMASCGEHFMRMAFFFFNLIFWILGIAVLGVGIYSRIESSRWNVLVSSKTIPEAANILIGVGVIVAVIGLLGCWGAIQKKQWMLVSYSVLVILIFSLEIIAGVYACIKKHKVQTALENGLKKAISQQYKEKDTVSKGISEAVDWIQQNVQCCGFAGPTDWEHTEWFRTKTDNSIVPKSCCTKKNDRCNVGSIQTLIDDNLIFEKGCIYEGKRFARRHMLIIGIVGIGIGIIEVLGIVIAITLCKHFRKEEKVVSAL